MKEKDIFKHLLKLGQDSPNRDGAVTAALVRNEKIFLAAPSIDSGVIVHGEHNLLGYVYKSGDPILPEDTLYTTLEPCSGRFDSSLFIPDCTSIIIASGVKNIVYAATDPVQSALSGKRFEVAGVRVGQAQDQDIIEQARELFNSKVVGYSV